MDGKKMGRYHRRRNRSGLNKERWIMIGSSVFVLTALTVTGLYMRGQSQERNDGYVVDFSAIENGNNKNGTGTQLTENISGEAVTSDDLDYDPYFQETNSKQVKNYESADSLSQDVKEQIGGPEIEAEISGTDVEIGEAMFAQPDTLTGEEAAAGTEENPADTPAISTAMQPALTFSDSDNLIWPIVGNVLINYSMDKTVYFATLDQYKYNPAIIIQATEGEMITAAAAGKVSRIYTDPQIGSCITIDLGGGYEVTYGQLTNILVSEGSYVASGDVIADVAAPTKYFSVEGTNVYFKLTKDGQPVNPMTKLN